MSIGGQHIQIYNSGSRTYEIDIPYDVSDSALKDGLKHSLNGFDMVDMYQRGELRLNAFWMISYIGFNGIFLILFSIILALLKAISKNENWWNIQGGFPLII